MTFKGESGGYGASYGERETTLPLCVCSEPLSSRARRRGAPKLSPWIAIPAAFIVGGVGFYYQLDLHKFAKRARTGSDTILEHVRARQVFPRA